MPLHVELVSPERKLWSGEATMVIARTIGGGDIAFLPGHAPFLGALEVDVVTVRTVDGDDQMAAVHGGFVQVDDDRVTILSDVAELASAIDSDRARAALERADAKVRAEDDATAIAALARANARLKAAGGNATAH